MRKPSPSPSVSCSPRRRGELLSGEPHPLAFDPRRFLLQAFRENPQLPHELMLACSSCDSQNNSIGDVIAETLRRFLANEHIGERFWWGLAWFLREHGDLVTVAVQSQKLKAS